MSWTPDHPGGQILCDHPGCNKSRRNYCPPAQRDEWTTRTVGAFVQDRCPNHSHDGEAQE